MKIKTIFAVILGILGLAIQACHSDKSKTVTPASEEIEIIPVKTVPVQTKEYAREIVASGMLGSTSEARLSFKTGGIISRIYVKEGDQVSKGQLLATLDLTEIQSQVQQANLGVEKAGRDLQRAKNLYQDTVATLETVQNATTALDAAKQQYQIATFNRQYSEIHAPGAGRILKKLMNESEMTGPGTPVLLLNEAGNSEWVVRTGVADKDWAVLRKGDRAEVRFDAYPGMVFPGKVNRLAEMADPYSGTYEIEIQVLPQGQKFANGLFGETKLFPSLKPRVYVIPIEALLEGNGASAYVYVLAPDQHSVIKKKVIIAYLGEKEVGIASGLNANDQLVTDGSAYLTESSNIKVVL